MLLPTVRTLSGHEFVAQLVEYVQKNEAAITSGEVKFTLQPQRYKSAFYSDYQVT